MVSTLSSLTSSSTLSYKNVENKKVKGDSTMAANTKVVNNTSVIDNAKLMDNSKQVERAGRDQGVGPKKQKILKLLIGNEPLSHFTLTYSFHEFEILCVLCFHFHNIWNSIGWVKCQFWKKNRTKLSQLSRKIFDTKQALTTCGAFSQRSRPRIIFHSTYDNFFVTFTTKVPYWPFCAKMIQFLI